MNLAVIVGIVAGFFVVFFPVVLAKGNLMLYIDLGSALTTIGGSICAMHGGHGFKKFFAQSKWLRLVMRIPVWGEERIIARLVAFSEKARREGLLALEDDLEELEDEFLRKGIQLVVDGTDPEIIKNVLYTELNQMQNRHEEGANFYDDWASFAPAFGMIGTLTGLVAMLQNINDKSSVGLGMSLALITSLYGAFMCYLVFQPVYTRPSRSRQVKYPPHSRSSECSYQNGTTRSTSSAQARSSEAASARIVARSSSSVLRSRRSLGWTVPSAVDTAIPIRFLP